MKNCCGQKCVSALFARRYENIIPHNKTEEKPFLSRKLNFVQNSQSFTAKILKILHIFFEKNQKILDFCVWMMYNNYA